MSLTGATIGKTGAVAAALFGLRRMLLQDNNLHKDKGRSHGGDLWYGGIRRKLPRSMPAAEVRTAAAAALFSRLHHSRYGVK